jgi:hypothetical protein
MLTEDPASPLDVQSSDIQSRARLVRAESLAALAAAGCTSPEKFVPLVEEHLRAIFVSPDVGLKIFAVDAKGLIRTGPKGPESAADVVRRVRDEIPEIFR